MNVVGLLEARNARDDFDAVTSKWGHKVSVVDLGIPNWTYYSNQQGDAYMWTQLSGQKLPVDDNTIANILCSKYSSDTYYRVIYNVTASINTDKIVAFGTNGRLVIKDNSYTDAASFKSAMNGVLLFFELAEPWEETVTPQPITLQKGYNALRQIDGSLANTSAEVTYKKKAT